MTTYWKSTPKHWCKMCKIYITDSKRSLRTHAEGRRHKEALDLHMKKMRDKTHTERREKQEMDHAMREIERAAQAAYQKDVDAGLKAAKGGMHGIGQRGQAGSREYRPPGVHAPGAPVDFVQHYNAAYGHAGLPPEYAAYAARQAQEAQLAQQRAIEEEQARVRAEKAKADAIMQQLQSSLGESETTATATPAGPPGMGAAPPGMSRKRARPAGEAELTAQMMLNIQQKVLSVQKAKEEAANKQKEPSPEPQVKEEGPKEEEEAAKEPTPEPVVEIDEDTGLGVWAVVEPKKANKEAAEERKDGDIIITPWGREKYKAPPKKRKAGDGTGAKGVDDEGVDDDSEDDMIDYASLQDVSIVKRGKGAREREREAAADALREVDASITFKVKTKKRRKRGFRPKKNSLKGQ